MSMAAFGEPAVPLVKISTARSSAARSTTGAGVGGEQVVEQDRAAPASPPVRGDDELERRAARLDRGPATVRLGGRARRSPRGHRSPPARARTSGAGAASG